MIGRLRGEILHKKPPHLLLEVNGVGYEVEAPLTTFFELPEVGGQVILLTHLVVRDDAHVLYGFAREAERELFRTLLRVSGVGAKMALAVLSGMSADAFARCIQAEDVNALMRLPGVGRKTAQRLIVELRDRLGGGGAGLAQAPAAATGRPDTPVSDAVSALTALGYKPADAARMVRAVESEGLGSEEIIRAALKAAARR